MVGLKVATNWQVFEQCVSNRIARARASLAKLVEVKTEKDGLVLDVMAEESTDLEVVGAPHFREIVFPDEEVFFIAPGGSVQQRGIAIRPPESRKCRALRLREYRRKLGSDLVVERLTCRVSRDKDIVARTRELKVVYGR